MENKKRLLVVLAGLLHDTGKLLERGEVFKEARTDDTYLAFCPKARKGGYPTHMHVTHTRAFCDWLEERFDCLKNTPDKSWKDWCAGHHLVEGGSEAAVIRISDRLSSSERDEGTHYQKDIHRKTLLEPVLERVSLEGHEDCLRTRYRYPLRPLTSDRESVFPVRGEDLHINGRSPGLKEMKGAEGAVSDPSGWSHLIADDTSLIVDAYRELGEGLIKDIQNLSENHGKDMVLPDLLICLMTLLEKYTAGVPSATNVRHPDISLFDHLRTTAAIAQALYLYREEKEEQHTVLPEDDDIPRWLLVCGDFSGIQKFIYNLSSKGAAKGLRGRSFYVGHFCRICSDYLLNKLGLHRAALLYNSGGKFYLLIPSHLKKKLYEVRAEVNHWLLERFRGDVFFGLGIAEVTAPMFSQGKMNDAWETAALDLERDRQQKFRERLADVSFFAPQTEDNPAKHCRVCGSNRDLKERDRDGEKILRCDSCHEMEMIGKNITDTAALFIFRGTKEEGIRIRTAAALSAERFFFIEKLKTAYLLIPEDRLHILKNITSPGECIFFGKYADMNFAKLHLPNAAVSFLHIGKWEKNRCIHENGDPWDFEDYAKKSQGISRMGILRMDVDNLGMVFIKGLHFPERKNKGWGAVSGKKSMASISRMVTLSRQLNLFFSGYLPRILENGEFDRCQIIYAGGDDLFIIGSWDQLPDLAEKIRSEFREFCCMNPVFSISGGLHLQGGKYPVYKGAQMAGEAEKKAKTLREEWGIAQNTLHKDAFCFLAPIAWEDYEKAKKIQGILEKEMKKDRGFLSWLSRMTAGNKVLAEHRSRKQNISLAKAWQDIVYESWRWRTAYQLRRRYGKDEDMIKQWTETLFPKDGEERSKIPVHAWLEMPVRWTEFLYRKS